MLIYNEFKIQKKVILKYHPKKKKKKKKKKKTCLFKQNIISLNKILRT